MSKGPLTFIVPGDLNTATGGYAYDRRIIAGLRAIGWNVRVQELDPSFPFPTAEAVEHAYRLLMGLPAGELVIVDGLALGAMPEVVDAQAARLKLLALVHHPLAEECGLAPEVARALRDSERRALEKVGQVIVTSTATREVLRAYGVQPDRVTVIEPGTDTMPLARGSSDGLARLLCVATLTPRKGHDLLIEALAPLAAQRWHLDCVGSLTRSPATVDALRLQIRHFCLETRVNLAGEVDPATLSAFFDEADLFVLPTRFEGYGMAVAEALAHGLPVIGTRTGAIPELLAAQAGLVVEPGDVAGLSLALESVLGSKQRLSSLAAGARRVREHLPDWSRACSLLSDVLDQVLSQPGAAR